jgi:hypothetical protein
LDIVLGSSSAGKDTLTFLAGDGLVGFSTVTKFEYGSGISDLLIEDFDANGIRDFAVLNKNAEKISIFLGEAGGTYTLTSEINVGLSPTSIVAGDFNKDGKIDLATSNGGSDNISILLGDATGTFSLTYDISVGTSPSALVVGDINKDGNLDIASSNSGSNNVSILHGDGLGNFSVDASISVGTNPSSLALVDIDGDGDLDIAVSSFDSDSIAILAQRNGSFIDTAHYAVGSEPTSIAVGDFDADGDQDLAISNQGTDNVTVLYGTSSPILGNYPKTTIAYVSGNTTVTPSAAPRFTYNLAAYTSTDFKGVLSASPVTGVIRITDAHPAGKYNVTVYAGDGLPKTFELVVNDANCSEGTVTPTTEVGVGDNPQSVAIGDFNSDGKQDLAVANATSNGVVIRFGDGLGGFSGNTLASTGAGSSPFAVVIGDFNRDGKQDIATANKGSNNVSIFQGNGSGGFTSNTNYPVGINPVALAIGDFNGDSKLDLATSNSGSDKIMYSSKV